MRILALDPGRLTGWAYSAAKDTREASGVWDLGPDAGARPGRLSDRLRLAIKQHQPTIVAVEIATMGGKFPQAQMRLNELAGAIKAVAQKCGCECWEFGIGTWKARAIGNGRAQKPDVIRGLRTYFGIEVTDDNEADAIGILLAAQMGPPPESAKKQARRVAKAIAKQQKTLFGSTRARK